MIERRSAVLDRKPLGYDLLRRSNDIKTLAQLVVLNGKRVFIRADLNVLSTTRVKFLTTHSSRVHSGDQNGFGRRSGRDGYFALGSPD